MIMFWIFPKMLKYPNIWLKGIQISIGWFYKLVRGDFWVYFEYIVCFYDGATFVLQLSKNEEDAEIKQKATEIEHTQQRNID